MFVGGSHRRICLVSLESAGGALVDAGSTVAALGGVDDRDVLAGDGVLGADVDACTACDALGSVNCNHSDYLAPKSDDEYKKLIKRRLGTIKKSARLFGAPQIQWRSGTDAWHFQSMKAAGTRGPVSSARQS